MCAVAKDGWDWQWCHVLLQQDERRGALLWLCCYVCYVTGVFFCLIRFISSSSCWICWSCCLSIFSPLLLLLPFCWCTCCQHCRGSFIIFIFIFLIIIIIFFFSLRLLKLPRLCASFFSYSCCSCCCCLLTVVPYSLVKKNQRPGQVDSVVWCAKFRMDGALAQVLGQRAGLGSSLADKPGAFWCCVWDLRCTSVGSHRRISLAFEVSVWHTCIDCIGCLVQSHI